MCVISLLLTSPENYKKNCFIQRKCLDNEEITHLLGLNILTVPFLNTQNMFTTESLLIVSVHFLFFLAEMCEMVSQL